MPDPLLSMGGRLWLEVVRAWLDRAVICPQTIHHLGHGNFMVAGERIKLKSRMK
jgi:hypothetical protein